METRSLARALIGCVLVREHGEGRTAGRIVETEAYPAGDPASHAFIGERERTRSMFRSPFHAYVYFIYGTYFCFNVTSESEGVGAAVLVRALEPLEGIELMQRRRGTEVVRDLCRGPGRLCAAMAIDRRLDGVALIGGAQLRLAPADRPAAKIGTSRRIGLSKAAHRPWRFYEQGSRYVSGPRSLSL